MASRRLGASDSWMRSWLASLGPDEGRRGDECGPSRRVSSLLVCQKTLEEVEAKLEELVCPQQETAERKCVAEDILVFVDEARGRISGCSSDELTIALLCAEAESHVYLHNFSRSFHCISQALALDRECAPARFVRGLIMKECKQYQQALVDFSHCTRHAYRPALSQAQRSLCAQALSPGVSKKRPAPVSCPSSKRYKHDC